MTIIDISGKTIAQRAEIFKPIGLKLDHTGVPKGLSLTFSPPIHLVKTEIRGNISVEPILLCVEEGFVLILEIIVV
ncbi:hypothetical protein [Escherichia coli]|uniref:hypothetical protein n=1 Tax=Escherichia coli TaxID=562 RepID=UPI00208DA564|nr:hypothetical protein [Escherichia coli]